MMAARDIAFDPDFAAPSEWAAMYRACGLQVVPARYPMRTREDKRPGLVGWKEFQEELVSDGLFGTWFPVAAKPNMGLITGRASDNIFVVDLDEHTHEAARLWWQGALVVNTMGDEPETWAQVTGGGGRQLFFRAPPGWHAPTNRTPIGVDIRGQGGFAMLPPSVHMSGKAYEWAPGCAPWETDIADAPQWLLEAIDSLVEQFGGDTGSSSGGERTPNASADFNAFGARIDGREDAMSRLVWGAVVGMHRDNGGEIPEDGGQAVFTDALERYLRDNRTRIPNVENVAGLERECRGPSAFKAKWDKAVKQWDGKVAEHAAAPRPERPQETQREAPPFVDDRPIRTFDFANLVLANVPEEPDLIEPNLLGNGGFLLIGGPPKAQKSWLLQDILVSAATGHSFLSDTFKVPRPLRIFWLQAEMNEKLLRRRAKAVTGLTGEQINDLASNLIVSDRFRMILDPDGVKVAADLIKSQFPDEPPDVLAFDPMANLFDQENENDNAQVMKFLTLRIEAVRQLVNPMAGVILVHHATKKGPDEIRRDPFNCFRGGGALRGHYDAGIIIFRKSDEAEEREIHFELRAGDTPEPMTVKLDAGRMVKSAAASRFGFEPDKKGWPDIDTCRLILTTIDTAWRHGTPWSNAPQARRLGRFAPEKITNTWGSITPKVAQDIINKWLMNGILEVAEADKHKKLSGLKTTGVRL